MARTLAKLRVCLVLAGLSLVMASAPTSAQTTSPRLVPCEEARIAGLVYTAGVEYFFMSFDGTTEVTVPGRDHSTTIEVDFGDGTALDFELPDLNGRCLTLVHAWEEPGEYQVTGTVRTFSQGFLISERPLDNVRTVTAAQEPAGETVEDDADAAQPTDGDETSAATAGTDGDTVDPAVDEDEASPWTREALAAIAALFAAGAVTGRALRSWYRNLNPALQKAAIPFLVVALGAMVVGTAIGSAPLLAAGTVMGTFTAGAIGISRLTGMWGDGIGALSAHFGEGTAKAAGDADLAEKFAHAEDDHVASLEQNKTQYALDGLKTGADGVARIVGAQAGKVGLPGNDPRAVEAAAGGVAEMQTQMMKDAAERLAEETGRVENDGD